MFKSTCASGKSSVGTEAGLPEPRAIFSTPLVHVRGQSLQAAVQRDPLRGLYREPHSERTGYTMQEERLHLDRGSEWARAGAGVGRGRDLERLALLLTLLSREMRPSSAVRSTALNPP